MIIIFKNTKIKKTIIFILIIHYLHELNDPKCAQLITGLLNSCQKFHALKIVPRSLLAKRQKNICNCFKFLRVVFNRWPGLMQ